MMSEYYRNFEFNRKHKITGARHSKYRQAAICHSSHFKRKYNITYHILISFFVSPKLHENQNLIIPTINQIFRPDNKPNKTIENKKIVNYINF